MLIWENQVGIRYVSECIDQIFRLLQVLDHQNSFQCSTIAVFLNLKVVFWSCQLWGPVVLFIIEERNRGVHLPFMGSLLIESKLIANHYPDRTLKVVFIRVVHFSHFIWFCHRLAFRYKTFVVWNSNKVPFTSNTT